MLHQPKTVRSSRPFHPTKMPQILVQIPVISGPKDNNAHPDKQAQQQQQRRPSESTTTSAKARPARFPFRRPEQKVPPRTQNSPDAALAALAFSFFFLAALALVLRPIVIGDAVCSSGRVARGYRYSSPPPLLSATSSFRLHWPKMLIQHELLNDTHRNTHHLLFIRFRNSSSLF